MRYFNYLFLRNTNWMFSIQSPIPVIGFSAYCTATLNGISINASTNITGNIIDVIFNNTNIPAGNYKYDVEIHNGTENYTIQRGIIQII